MLEKYKNAIIVVIIIAISFSVYWLFKSNVKEDGDLVTTGYTEVDILGEDIIKALNQIESLELNPAIISDPIVRNLRDYSRDIIEEPHGNVNLFAPLGDVVILEDRDSSDESGEEGN
jgi:hypothetical protein